MKNRTITSARTAIRRKRRGHARLFVLGAAFAASSVALGRPAVAAQVPAAQVSAAPGQGTQTYAFELPAGPLETVIAGFERVTGRRIALSNTDLAGIRSPGVSGTLTADAALRQLLTGTSIRATAEGDGFRLGIASISEQIEVTGRAPSVSSPRYTVPLRDVAQTVALIPRTVIEEQGATTLGEVLKNVPGITLQAGEGGGASGTAGDMFTMRGFNASNSLFVDNVRDDGMIARDVFNLEQVEVFMGPTGSDVGRGTAAGYVNMQSKTPHLGSSSSVNVGFGSADQARLSADFNWAPEASAAGSWASKSAFRINALWQDRGVPGRDIVSLNSKAVAPSVGIGLGTPTRVFASAQIMRQDNVPDYGIPSAAWLDEPLAPTVVRAPRAVDQSNFYGSPDYDYDRASQDTYTARVEHDATRSLTLRNQTRYITTHREAAVSAITGVGSYNATTNLVSVARQGNERENAILSNQTSIVDRFSTGPLRHGVSAGLEYSHEEQSAPGRAGLGTRAPADIFSPNPFDPVTGYDPQRTLAESGGSTHTVALYAFDTVEVAQRWLLSGGLRWERYSTQFESINVTGVSTADLEGDGTLISGKASVLFRVNDEGNVYLSYGTTLTPPGAANFSLSAQANNANNPSVEPQRSANVEVGTKWDVANGRLSLNGAAFRTANENVIYTVDGAAVPPIFNQDDGQLVRGVSLGALGRLTDRWEVIANVAYLDAELQTQNLVNDGRRLTLTPEWSGSIWSTVHLPRGINVGAGIRHTGSSFINAANTIRLPSFQIVDALAEYAVNTHLSLRLNIYNLTDEVYIRSINNNGGRYNPGYARSAMFTSNVRF